MHINGWKIKWHHIVFFAGLLTTVIGGSIGYGETRGGLKDLDRRITKVECKQEQIWEMVRTQHVYDSLKATIEGDSIFQKAVDIAKNGHVDSTDTIQ